METILKIIIVIGILIDVYAVFLRRKILAWGATKDEVKMPLTGDGLAPWISAERVCRRA